MPSAPSHTAHSTDDTAIIYLGPEPEKLERAFKHLGVQAKSDSFVPRAGGLPDPLA
jgi:hypothetical protein